MKTTSKLNNVVYWLYDDTCREHRCDGYIGITCNFKMRIAGHRRSGRMPAGFRVEVIYSGTREECAAFEKQYRPKPNIGWNISSGGCGGHIPSLATRQRQREAKLGKKQSPELIAKRMASRKGRPLSPEHRMRLSAAKKGIPKSDGHRAKLSAANRGKRLSPETCAKLSAIRRGRTLAQEHRQHIRDAIRVWHAQRNTGPMIEGG
jgi:hypothetical protein